MNNPIAVVGSPSEPLSVYDLLAAENELSKRGIPTITVGSTLTYTLTPQQCNDIECALVGRTDPASATVQMTFRGRDVTCENLHSPAGPGVGCLIARATDGTEHRVDIVSRNAA